MIGLVLIWMIFELNPSHDLDGESFDIWKERIQIFFYSIVSDKCSFILNGPFVHIHFVINEVVDKPNYLWTTYEKRKVKLEFQAMYLMTDV